MRPVQRMGNDADELSRAAAREQGIAVEGDAVAHIGQYRWIPFMNREAGVRRSTQQVIEFLEFPPFALPADPGSFTRVPLAHPMEEMEEIAAPLSLASVQFGDPGARRLEQLGVSRHLLFRGIREVGDEGEVDERIGIPECHHLEVFQELCHSIRAGEQGWDHHHGPGFLRNPVQEVEPWQPPRRD